MPGRRRSVSTISTEASSIISKASSAVLTSITLRRQSSAMLRQTSRTCSSSSTTRRDRGKVVCGNEFSCICGIALSPALAKLEWKSRLDWALAMVFSLRTELGIEGAAQKKGDKISFREGASFVFSSRYTYCQVYKYVKK